MPELRKTITTNGRTQELIINIHEKEFYQKVSSNSEYDSAEALFIYKLESILPSLRLGEIGRIELKNYKQTGNRFSIEIWYRGRFEYRIKDILLKTKPSTDNSSIFGALESKNLSYTIEGPNDPPRLIYDISETETIYINKMQVIINFNEGHQMLIKIQIPNIAASLTFKIKLIDHNSYAKPCDNFIEYIVGNITKCLEELMHKTDISLFDICRNVGKSVLMTDTMRRYALEKTIEIDIPGQLKYPITYNPNEDDYTFSMPIIVMDDTLGKIELGTLQVTRGSKRNNDYNILWNAIADERLKKIYEEKQLKKDIDYCLAQIRVIMSSQLVFNPYIRESNQPVFQNVEDLAKIIESIQANKAGILIITDNQIIYSDYLWKYGMKNATNGTKNKKPVNKDPGDEIRALLKKAYPNQPEEVINQIWKQSVIFSFDEYEDMPNTRSLSLYIPTANKKAILTPNQLDTLLILFNYLKPYIAYAGLSHVSSNYPQLTLFSLEDMHEILKAIVPITPNSILYADENIIGIPLDKLLKLIEQHKRMRIKQ